MSPFKFAKEVERVIDQQVRPQLRKDGGDLELVDIKERIVYCRLVGACSSCVAGGQTLKLLVERALKEEIDERIRVVAV